MIIQKSNLTDLKEIVNCHRDAFPNSLSSKQGSRFISKMMEWYITSERGILFHIYSDLGEMAGYCGGIVTRKPGLLGAFSSITQYAFNVFLISYLVRPWLLFHPQNQNRFPVIFKNLLIKVGLKQKQKPQTQKNYEEFIPFMGLVVIGVKNKYHGKGYGSILLQEFERVAREDGSIKRIQLSVKAHNSKAIKSYLRNGWQISKQDYQSKQLIKDI